MINYFDKKVKFLQHNGLKDIHLKEIFHDDVFYHKFYMRDELKNGYKELDFDKIISGINEFSNGMILSNKQWPENGAIYFKCIKAKYTYKINNQKLIDKFKDIETYYTWLCDNFIRLQNLTYPSQNDDLCYGNVAVQEDLSWKLVDFDVMFEEGVTMEYREYVLRTALKFASANLPKKYNRDYAYNFISKYLLANRPDVYK